MYDEPQLYTDRHTEHGRLHDRLGWGVVWYGWDVVWHGRHLASYHSEVLLGHEDAPLSE